MASPRKLERQRERVRELLRADPSRSMRSIAAEVGCSHVTVSRIRAGLTGPLADADGPANPRPGSENLIEPAGPGNQRAVTHGAYSQARREPLEAMHRDRLRLAFPAEADDLVNAMAKRAAMIDLFSAWITDAGVLVAVKGKPMVTDAARELRLLLRDHEQAVGALLERAAAASRGSFDAELAEAREAWERRLGESDASA